MKEIKLYTQEDQAHRCAHAICEMLVLYSLMDESKREAVQKWIRDQADIEGYEEDLITLLDGYANEPEGY